MTTSIPGELRVILNHALQSLDAAAALRYESGPQEVGAVIGSSRVSAMFLRAWLQQNSPSATPATSARISRTPVEVQTTTSTER